MGRAKKQRVLHALFFAKPINVRPETMMGFTIFAHP
jgi:hypothetical protein